MKLLPLTQGYFAQVDDEDYERVSQFTWCAQKVRGKWRAMHQINVIGDWGVIRLHSFVLGITDGKMRVELKDGNALNCQKNNLRTRREPPKRLGVMKLRKLCEHSQRRNLCMVCLDAGTGGGSICEHGRDRSVCKECKGTSICEHGLRRIYCQKCKVLGTGGVSRCEHDRVRANCEECGGFPIMARHMQYGARGRAKKDNVPFTITVQDILEMIGDGKCPVFGTPYKLASRKQCDESATLDKFIPELGYTKDNCAVISWRANDLKRDATAEELLRVTRWMYQQATV
jgi:hypothetical protein